MNQQGRAIISPGGSLKSRRPSAATTTSRTNSITTTTTTMMSPSTPSLTPAVGPSTSSFRIVDNDYDYRTPELYRHYTQTLPSPDGPTPMEEPPTDNDDVNSINNPIDGEDALLDLVQLEELQMEAEKMKALGNKHMASQEYTRAFNAYSAALQLCPVGPSSHVFLCNRAAALLSLKRYQAAAIDARRAVALAPTFGKAHARLGQALYFIKDYAGAVRAYEDALEYEPDNTVTITYLEKARAKLSRKHDRSLRLARGEDVSLAEESMPATVIHSVATDPHGSAAVVRAGGFRGESLAIRNAVAGVTVRSPPTMTVSTTAQSATSPLTPEENRDDTYHVNDDVTRNDDPNETLEEDPDLEEAVRIQQRANQYLTKKNYKAAIEEYSAALFLVPDDPFLSPELHLGRAHALNGSRRHESARHDAQMAIKLQPTPEAYSTLAKTMFYLKDFAAAIIAFEECRKLLPQNVKLSMFDQAYLDKIRNGHSPGDDHRSVSSRISVVPKLPPPRFVPREEALQSTPNMPPMPKQWPLQSPQSPSSFLCGPERVIYFLSEALGIKLNRGADGIVRVLSVTPDTPGSLILRQGGPLQEGDVVREAAGVDLRRPITNVMWGDTVALIKIAPRPIMVMVAKELSPIPIPVLEERKRQKQLEERLQQRRAQEPDGSVGGGSSYDEEDVGDGQHLYEEDNWYYHQQQQPSPSSGEEKVQIEPPAAAEGVSVRGNTASTVVSDEADFTAAPNAGDLTAGQEVSEAVAGTAPSEVLTPDSELDTEGKECKPRREEEESTVADETSEVSDTILSPQTFDEGTSSGLSDASLPPEEAESQQQDSATAEAKADVRQPLSLRDVEMNTVGGEILFEEGSLLAYSGWDRLRWMSYSGARKVRFCETVARLSTTRKNFFWTTSGDDYLPRKLVIYDEPQVMLLLRRPNDVVEIRRILDLPSGMILVNKGDNIMDAFWIVESVIEPKACKLRLSPLTTVTSVETSVAEDAESRRYSCFELVTPAETIIISAVRKKNGGKKSEIFSENNEALVETEFLEAAIGTALFQAHILSEEGEMLQRDRSWKHQIILGTFHSYVISGNQATLEKSITCAMSRLYPPTLPTDGSIRYLPSQLIDARDENGFTALHYACSRGFSAAVIMLVNAGADVTMKTKFLDMSPAHLCALNLDDSSLSTILATTHPSRPDLNEVDALGRTPMYTAAVDGKTGGGSFDSLALGRCLSALEAWGGQLIVDEACMELQHPVSLLAGEWRSDCLFVLLQHVAFRYPLQMEKDVTRTGISLSAMFHYPVHCALITLRREVQLVMNGEHSQLLGSEDLLPECRLVRTLRVLFEHGFEPNERLERFEDTEFDGAAVLNKYCGFTPIQILGAAALDAIALQQVAEKSDRVDASLLMKTFGDLCAAAEFLVRNGARLSLEPPPDSRRMSRSSSSSSSVDRSRSASDHSTDNSKVDRSSLKFDSNKQLLQFLGGEGRLAAAKKEFAALPPVPSTAKLILLKDKGFVLEHSGAPGGSDDKSCAICWKAFGALINRKYVCRVTRRFLCDDCSSKRVVDDGEEIRISDGQFLLARVEAAKEESDRQQTDLERGRIHQLRAEREEIRLRRLEAEEETNRESLFSGVMDMASNLFVQDDVDNAGDDKNVAGLSHSLGQTRNALVERGAKLESLGDKTSRLADASRDFAQMAKELSKETQKGGLFW